MLLSIVVPVYNVEKYVGQCLGSIIDQIRNDKEVEIIVVNDGTKDNSMSVVKGLITNDVQIRILEQPNGGLSMARNNGLDAALGDFVWFVDSDDYLKPDAISYLKVLLSVHRDYDVFASYMDRYYEDSKKYEVKRNKYKENWEGKEYLFRKMPKGAAQRFIYRRAFLNDNHLRFTPGILHEDGVWGCEMLYLAHKLFLLQESVYVYRLRSGSIMSSMKIKSAYDLVKGHKLLMEFLNTSVLEEDYFAFRNYIFSQLACVFGYMKPLYSTSDFKSFYEENEQYIRSEATWLVNHGSRNVFPVFISKAPKLFMSLLLLRGRIIKFIK